MNIFRNIFGIKRKFFWNSFYRRKHACLSCDLNSKANYAIMYTALTVISSLYFNMFIILVMCSMLNTTIRKRIWHCDELQDERDTLFYNYKKMIIIKPRICYGSWKYSKQKFSYFKTNIFILIFILSRELVIRFCLCAWKLWKKTLILFEE